MAGLMRCANRSACVRLVLAQSIMQNTSHSELHACLFVTMVWSQCTEDYDVSPDAARFGFTFLPAVYFFKVNG